MQKTDDILRRAGILGCDKLKTIVKDEELLIKVEQLKQDFISADSEKLKILSFVFHEVKVKAKKEQ